MTVAFGGWVIFVQRLDGLVCMTVAFGGWVIFPRGGSHYLAKDISPERETLVALVRFLCRQRLWHVHYTTESKHLDNLCRAYLTI